MPARPSELPVWNTDATNRTTPSAGQQASGWLFQQIPPSSYENWRANLVYEWCVYVNAASPLPLEEEHLVSTDGAGHAAVFTFEVDTDLEVGDTATVSDLAVTNDGDVAGDLVVDGEANVGSIETDLYVFTGSNPVIGPGNGAGGIDLAPGFVGYQRHIINASASCNNHGMTDGPRIMQLITFSNEGSGFVRGEFMVVGTAVDGSPLTTPFRRYALDLSYRYQGGAYTITGTGLSSAGTGGTVTSVPQALADTPASDYIIYLAKELNDGLDETVQVVGYIEHWGVLELT